MSNLREDPSQTASDAAVTPSVAAESSDRFLRDQQLLEQHRAGDPDAMAELFKIHYPATLGWARRYARRGEDAEDLAGEAFTKAIEAIDRGRGPTLTMGLYLAATVRNLATRRGKDAKAVFPTDEIESYIGNLASEMPPVDGIVFEAFSSLPDRWQHVLWSRYVSGASNKETAQELGITPSAAAVLNHRARAGLRSAYLVAIAPDQLEDSCAEAVALIPKRVEGRLSAAQSATVDSHLRGCGSCRAVDRNLTSVHKRFAALLPAAAVTLFRPARSSAVPAVWFKAGFTVALIACAGFVLVSMTSAASLVAPGASRDAAPDAGQQAGDRHGEPGAAALTPPVVVAEAQSGQCETFVVTTTVGGTSKRAFETRSPSGASCEVEISWQGQILLPLSPVDDAVHFLAPRAGEYTIRLVTGVDDVTVVSDQR